MDIYDATKAIGAVLARFELAERARILEAVAALEDLTQDDEPEDDEPEDQEEEASHG